MLWQLRSSLFETMAKHCYVHTHIHSVSHSKAGVMAQKQHMGESNGICTIVYGIEWQGLA